MKKIVLALVVIAIIFVGVQFYFPDILYSSTWGQRIMLRLEGDQVAEFYFEGDKETKDTVYMKGVIYSGTLDDIKEVLQDNPELTTLVMVDVPGSIDDEVNLAASKEIRKQGVDTYIPKDGMVASGGTDMFLAGEKRKIHQTAKLGVHSWGGGEMAALDYPRDHEEHKKYLEYYAVMGIPLDFYWYTLEAAPAEDIHWMTEGEIEKYEVVTSATSKLLQNQKKLASDAFGGRATGNNLLAQELITSYFTEIGLGKFDDDYKQPFTFIDEETKKQRTGTNIVGFVEGTDHTEQYIVMSAHYDHLGVVNDTIYNGADDNASGTAALMELAGYFSKNPPEHSIIFAAFDAEELGLHGSTHFVDHSPIPLQNIILNINMDMISRNSNNEIYVVGTFQYPEYKSMVDKVSHDSKLNVSFGHDDPTDSTRAFWMNSSDNGPFFKKMIPNITFSEEDHPDYHKPSDDFENIDPKFYKNVVQLILEFTKEIDQNFPKAQ